METPKLLRTLGKILPKPTAKYRTNCGLYKCGCGKEFICRTVSINKGSTKSCGCFKQNKATSHGMTNHRLYKTWHNMFYRTTNKNYGHYENYGGRGIVVCDRWLDINNFISDMGGTYREGLSIDRINNDLGYSPNNCRWATSLTQRCNRSLIMVNNTSGYRGVTLNKKSNKWIAQIKVNKKHIYLGLFPEIIDAAKAYNEYIKNNELEYPLNIIPIKE